MPAVYCGTVIKRVLTVGYQPSCGIWGIILSLAGFLLRPRKGHARMLHLCLAGEEQLDLRYYNHAAQIFICSATSVRSGVEVFRFSGQIKIDLTLPVIRSSFSDFMRRCRKIENVESARIPSLQHYRISRSERCSPLGTQSIRATAFFRPVRSVMNGAPFWPSDRQYCKLSKATADVTPQLAVPTADC